MAKKRSVQAIIDLVRAVAPELAQDTLQAIAKRIHDDMGGTRLYIDKAPALGKAWRLGELLAAGVPLDQAIPTAGMSRRNAYRVLSRPWRKRSG